MGFVGLNVSLRVAIVAKVETGYHSVTVKRDGRCENDTTSVL
jgi:hypothetical protein